MATVSNVSVGKPQVGGAISVAPIGAAIPDNALEDLSAAYANLGYVSEDGLTNTNSPESDKVKAWGGDTVLVLQTAKEDTFSFTLIETKNEDVLKFVYGDDNVSGDLSTGLTITANATEQVTRIVVVDMILSDGVLKRIVIPNGKISEIGEITYADESAIGYEVTLEALPDESGNTHYEYVYGGTVSG